MAAKKVSARKAKSGPVAKPRQKLIKPKIESLYPWALNRSKAERAHIAIHADLEANNQQYSDETAPGYVDPADMEQRVMDHYTSHGGLVKGQERATVIGRHKNDGFQPGMTTTEVREGTGDNDEDEDDNTPAPTPVAEADTETNEDEDDDDKDDE